MTREDIIRMAQEAGIFTGGHPMNPWDVYPSDLEAFAALAFAAGAAHEREKVNYELLTLEKWKGIALSKYGDGRTVQQVEEEARAHEREECAKLCEGKCAEYYGEGIAEIIRERGRA